MSGGGQTVDKCPRQWGRLGAVCRSSMLPPASVTAVGRQKPTHTRQQRALATCPEQISPPQWPQGAKYQSALNLHVLALFTPIGATPAQFLLLFLFVTVHSSILVGPVTVGSATTWQLAYHRRFFYLGQCASRRKCRPIRLPVPLYGALYPTSGRPGGAPELPGSCPPTPCLRGQCRDHGLSGATLRTFQGQELEEGLI